MADLNNFCAGRKPVIDLIQNSPEICLELLIAENINAAFKNEIINLARENKILYKLVKNDVLEKFSRDLNHQGVICKIKSPQKISLEEFLKSISKRAALIVILDHIEDPHNLGAVIRTAEAGGASCVIIPDKRAALPNATVFKTSAGASLRLPVIQVVNISRAIEILKQNNFWVAGLDEKSDTSIYANKLPERLALVLGAEGNGISRLVKQNCDMLIKIPIKNGGVGSLNASVACALGIFEWTKERLF